jgi:hypothetical protein
MELTSCYKKKAEPTQGCSFGSSAVFIFVRPAAFRPFLTEGLALSRINIISIYYYLIIHMKVCQFHGFATIHFVAFDAQPRKRAAGVTHPAAFLRPLRQWLWP